MTGYRRLPRDAARARMRLMTNLVTFKCPLCGDQFPVTAQKRICFPESQSLKDREAKVCALCWGNLIIKLKRGLATEQGESWGGEDQGA